MASTINAKNTSTGVVITPDASGQLELQTADTTRMTITSSGNVGVGTSSPTGKFNIITSNTASSAYFRNINASWASDVINEYAPNGTTVSRAYFSCRSDGTTWVTSDYGAMLFLTGTSGSTSERMRIDSNGNVLVGTTVVPSSASTSGVSIVNNSGTSGRITFGKTASGTLDGALFYFGATYVGGITYSNTAVAYNTSSDYRLKENITPMTGALEKVSLLNPVNWTWKSDGTNGQGFIAHELQAVVPDCVSGEKDAVDADGNPVYQGVDTSFLVATLTKAIQELKAELDTVKAELAELKGTA